MIYLIGGAPRVGKSILGQQLCTTLKVGWVSTDLMMELLRVANAAGRKMKWDAAPEAITAAAEWFFPYPELAGIKGDLEIWSCMVINYAGSSGCV